MSEPVSGAGRPPVADVGLLLEGTYPYVSGGVSSWVHQIINGFPDLTFAICFLGSRKQDYGEKKFQLPANVVHIEEHYLYESTGTPPVTPQRGDRDDGRTQPRAARILSRAAGAGRSAAARCWAASRRAAGPHGAVRSSCTPKPAGTT
jgi:hypothetical protein